MKSILHWVMIQLILPDPQQNLNILCPAQNIVTFFFFFYPQGLCINKVILGINNSSKHVIT